MKKIYPLTIKYILTYHPHMTGFSFQGGDGGDTGLGQSFPPLQRLVPPLIFPPLHGLGPPPSNFFLDLSIVSSSVALPTRLVYVFDALYFIIQFHHMRVVSQDIFYCANKKKVQTFSTFSELIIVIFEKKFDLPKFAQFEKKSFFGTPCIVYF